MGKNWIGILFCLVSILIVLVIVTGCSKSPTSSQKEILVSGETLSIKQEDFYTYMKSSRGLVDMENYVLLSLLREQYPIDSKDIDAALESEKLSYVDFDKSIRARDKTEFDIRTQLEVDLMLREAITQSTEVSTKTLALFHESWAPTRVANQMAVTEEELAGTIKEELEKGTPFLTLLAKYKEENVIPVEYKIEIGEDSYVDEGIKESIVELKNIGDVTVVQTDAYFFVYQLAETEVKQTFEEDKERVKQAYLETQFTSFNKEQIIRTIVLAENLTSFDSSFDTLFSRFKEEK